MQTKNTYKIGEKKKDKRYFVNHLLCFLCKKFLSQRLDFVNAESIKDTRVSESRFMYQEKRKLSFSTLKVNRIQQ